MPPAYPIKRLHDLQELDRKIQAREKALAEARAWLADESALAAARQRLQLAEARLSERMGYRRDLELALQQLREKLSGVEQKLYGGGVTNPRELTALNDEHAMLQRQLGEQEEKLLEAMVQVEEAQAAREQSRELAARLEGERNALRLELQGQMETLDAELAVLRRERSTLTHQVPAQVLSLYESLLKSRGGLAVARVERNLCQGCRITLPETDLRRARSGQAIVQCNSCRRILYVV